MNLLKKITTISLAMFIVTALQVNAAAAQEDNNNSGITPDDISSIKSEGFTIVPSNPNTINPRKFLFEIKPGESSEDYVTIHNLSDQPIDFLLYGADPTLSAQGTPAYKTRQSSGNGEGTWIQFDNPSITLQPNEQRIEHFTITVPKDTPLEEYRAGITMEKTKADSNNPNITIATRVILHATITVTDNPQPIPKMDGSFASSIQPTGSSWQIIYFWISLGLFMVSFIALIIVTYQERRKKINEIKPKKKPSAKTTRSKTTKSKKRSTHRRKKQ